MAKPKRLSDLIIARPGSAILAKAQEKNLPTFAIRVRGSVHPKTLAPLLKFIRAQRIDILDCHGSRDAVYGALVKLLTGVKVIRSRHVTDPIKMSGLHGLVWRHGNHGIITTAKKSRKCWRRRGSRIKIKRWLLPLASIRSASPRARCTAATGPSGHRCR